MISWITLSVALHATIFVTAHAQTPDCTRLENLVLETPDGSFSVANRMKELEVPGASVALIHDFKVACTATFGVRSKLTMEPVDEGTLFQVASISKPVTAVVALQLVDRGVLNLDRSINSYLLDWGIEPAPGTDIDTGEITVRQVLNHTAGLTTDSFPGYAPGSQLPTTLDILNGVAPANSEPVVAAQQPGQQYAYSGGGYTVLELLIEQESGLPFEEFIATSVFEPIQMTASTFDQPISDVWLGDIAMGYADLFDEIDGGFHVYPELAAAGLWTNAAQLGKFVIALQRSLIGDVEGALLSSASAREMMSPFEDTMSGLGIVVDEMYFTHGGHNRGYMSRFLAHDTHGYGFVILTNAEQPRFIGEMITSVGKTFGWEDF